MRGDWYYAFIKAIETGSFTKAAEELGYTQSAISQIVHSLEEELSSHSHFMFSKRYYTDTRW